MTERTYEGPAALSAEEVEAVSGGGGFHGSGTRQEEGGGGTIGSGT